MTLRCTQDPHSDNDHMASTEGDGRGRDGPRQHFRVGQVELSLSPRAAGSVCCSKLKNSEGHQGLSRPFMLIITTRDVIFRYTGQCFPSGVSEKSHKSQSHSHSTCVCTVPSSAPLGMSLELRAPFLGISLIWVFWGVNKQPGEP